MRIDRSHLPWFLATVGAALLAGLAYRANFHSDLLPAGLWPKSILGTVPPARVTYGGTPLGLIFGAIAFLIFLFAAALGVRKKKRLWPIGSVQTWLRAHVWLTVLTVPLIMFHSGFRLGGPHTVWLIGLYSVVMGSGVFGIVLQQFLPAMMRESLPREIVFEQIPFQRARLLEEATQLRAVVAEAAAHGVDGDTSPQVLLRFLDEECLPYLGTKAVRSQNLRNKSSALEMFKMVRVNVHPNWRPRVTELETWCESRRLMDLQTRFQHWLHGWLLLHIPSSVALIVLTAWHAWMGLRFLVTQPL
jgi:hypothetical protein